MSVKVESEALRKFLRNSLFEYADVTYGMYDRPGTQQAALGEEEEGDAPTIPHEVPIQPSEMMATQLVDQRPPVEDEEYVPDNVEELGRAADTLARTVPTDQVAAVYIELQRLIDNSITKHNNPDLPNKQEDQGAQEMEKVEEARLRRAINLVLSEAPGWDDEYSTGYNISDGEPDYAAMDDPPVDMEPDGSSLDNIADQFGYAGASGARQDIERMLQRMKYVAEEVGVKSIDELRNYAVQEFVDAMKAAEYIDEEDVVELQQSPAAVLELDSFRFFFVSAFVMPAYLEVKRVARKKAQAELDSLDLPQGAHQTIMNQALGETPRKPDKLEQKIMKAAMADGADADEIDRMVDRMKKGFDKIKELAKPGDGFVELAKEKWGKQAKGRREKVLAQALQQTSDFQSEA
jgi:hypothetical protein